MHCSLTGRCRHCQPRRLTSLVLGCTHVQTTGNESDLETKIRDRAHLRPA